MASLSSVFDRDILLRTVNANPERLTPFWTSGAFNTSDQIGQLIAGGSPTFEVPYIMDIDGDLEANYSNEIYTDIAMPRSIEAESMQGRMAYLNEHFIEARLTKALAAGERALPLIAQQVDGLWAQQFENRAVATVIGIRNADQAGTKALETNISTGTSPTDANRFNVDAFIDVESTMLQGQRGTGAIVVHPKVKAAMRKAQMLIPFTDPANLRQVDTYNGRVVVESEKGTLIPGTATTARYVSYFLNADSFVAESVRGERDMIYSATELTGNGAGHELLHTRRNVLIHPQGFSFVAAANTLTGGTKNQALFASWSDLTTAANWDMVLDAKQVPFRYLVTNI